MGIQNPQLISLALALNPFNSKYESLFVPQILHVKKTGNDTTGTGSEANPFLTINKAMSVLVPSGQIWVYSTGTMTTYQETTVDNPYVPPAVWLDPAYSAVGLPINGTVAHPCILRAAPSHEGLVQISGSGTLGGIVSAAKRNWIISGIRVVDCSTFGIASQGHVVLTPNMNLLSHNFTIENCLVDNVSAASEFGNVSGIAPWGTLDWTIRNCRITNINRFTPTTGNLVACIQSYGAINLLVQNVTGNTADYGVSMKDFFLYPNLVDAYDGVTIEQCNFKTRILSVQFNIRGTDTAHAGKQVVRNNILHSLGQGSFPTLYAEMGGALGQSTELLVENNIIRTDNNTYGLTAFNAFNDIKFRNNIAVGGSVQIQTNNNTAKQTLITSCDRNAYSVFTQAILNRYGTGETTFSGLTNWKAATSGNPSTLGVTNPDNNSIVAATSAMFENMAADDYRVKAGSPTIGLAGGGLNSGCYQTNLENIGTLPTYSAGV